MKTSNFHVSLPCHNVEETINFYVDALRCGLGRRYVNWVDLNLYGTEITFVQCDEFHFKFSNYTLDKEVLPSFHFGVVLSNDEWDFVLDHVKKAEFPFFSPTEYLIDEPGHHRSFFIEDPNGYMVELKTFAVETEIFSHKRKYITT